MSISYPNLPGIEVTVNDGGLILPEDGTTESMLIIGPSTKTTNLPSDPVLVRQAVDAQTYFGNFTDKNGVVNPLTAAWKAAFEGGNRRSYALALNPTGADDAAKTKDAFLKLHGLFFGSLADFTVDNVVLVDFFADKETGVLVSTDFPVGSQDRANFPNVPGIIKYGGKATSGAITLPLTIAPANNAFAITVGSTDHSITLTAATYDGTTKTLDDLALDIQTDLTALDTANTLKGFTAVADLDAGTITISGPVAFTLKVDATADALEDIGFADATASTKVRHENGTLYHGNFAELLASYCEDQTINHNTVKGFIGAQAPTISNSALGLQLSDIKTNVDRLSGLSNEYSGHVSVISGPELAYEVPGKAGVYYASGVVTYAALVSTLSPESAPTNKAVAGVKGMRYNLSLRQLNSLSGNKYVSFRVKNGAVYVTDGITTAPDIVIGGLVNKSDYTRLSTLRITHAAINLVRVISEPFIGEPAGIPQLNALNAAIQAGLNAMKQAGAIVDFRFSIVQDQGSAILGESKITLILVPAFETRKISVDVSLRPQLN